MACLLLLAGACGGAVASASHLSQSSAGTARRMRVSALGADAVLLHSRQSVTFTFRFAGAAPSSWSWRVLGAYGDLMASGKGQTAAGAHTGSVSWNCTQANGSSAGPGLYLVKVGANGAPASTTTTVGWVRFQPPVTAKVYTNLPAAGKRVALTFDDGGGKTAWYWILRELIAGHAQGTFFPIGEYVADYANRDAGLTLKDHMAIGSHSWSHPDLTTVTDAQVRMQLKQPDDIWWQDFHASTVPYLRPPYGAYNAHLLALAGQMGYSRIILWDVDSLDWTKPGVNTIVANVLDHVHDGSIILMHTRGQTPKALPLIIAGLHARGYQMVTIPELFKAAGVRATPTGASSHPAGGQ